MWEDLITHYDKEGITVLTTEYYKLDNTHIWSRVDPQKDIETIMFHVDRMADLGLALTTLLCCHLHYLVASHGV
jgi:hypothetical protein